MRRSQNAKDKTIIDSTTDYKLFLHLQYRITISSSPIRRKGRQYRHCTGISNTLLTPEIDRLSQWIYHPLHLSRPPGIWFFDCSLSENMLDTTHWLPHLNFTMTLVTREEKGTWLQQQSEFYMIVQIIVPFLLFPIREH